MVGKRIEVSMSFLVPSSRSSASRHPGAQQGQQRGLGSCSGIHVDGSHGSVRSVCLSFAIVTHRVPGRGARDCRGSAVSGPLKHPTWHGWKGCGNSVLGGAGVAGLASATEATSAPCAQRTITDCAQTPGRSSSTTRARAEKSGTMGVAGVFILCQDIQMFFDVDEKASV